MALAEIQHDYLALTRRRRLYGGLLVVIFVAMMVSGFRVADARNAGGFWQGLHQVGDFPAALVSEAVQKSANLPGHMIRALPALLLLWHGLAGGRLEHGWTAEGFRLRVVLPWPA